MALRDFSVKSLDFGSKDKSRDSFKMSKLSNSVSLSSGSSVSRRGSQSSHESDPSSSSADHTERKLQARHVQFIALGGSIGNNVFINCGIALTSGGPGSMLIAYFYWCLVILAVNDCLAEMVSYLPISSPFLRFSDRYVDEALSVAASWLFFLNQAFLLPFEVSLCCALLEGYNVPIPTVVVVIVCLLLWAILNISAVKYFGESEFWMAILKVTFACALFIMTFVIISGGNPKKDAIGFRYWNKPGSFAEYYYTGNKGRFLGFLYTLSQAAFAISGPEFVSMSAGEAELPRKTMPRAYKMTVYRLFFFFILNPITAGAIVPYNDETMRSMISKSGFSGASSPYAVGCARLGIKVLPEFITAFSFLAAFSAGNCYCYCASRNLFGLSLQGHAPKIFRKCLRNGVPIYAVIATLSVGLLSFLQVSKGSARVILWLIDLTRLGQLGIYCVCCITFLFWRRGIDAQSVKKSDLPYRSRLQPGLAYFALGSCVVMIFAGGFPVFLKGNWNTLSFIFSYASIPIFFGIYIFWKYFKKTNMRVPEEMDILSDKAEIDHYEDTFVEAPRKAGRVTRYADRLINVLTK